MSTATALPSTEIVEYTQGAVKKATTGMTSADLWKCPVERIVVDPDFNVRIQDANYTARVRSIADSIKANGYYADRPLAGYVGKADDGEDIIILIDGHRRYAAVMLAISEGVEMVEVPMVTKPRGTSMEDLTVALVTANDGDQLTPFEVAIVCKRLTNIGMDSKTIASRIGRTKVYVENLLDLVAAPKAIRDMVTSGKVSATLAVETLRKNGKDAATVLKAGTAVAEAAGKGKVTKKHVKAVTEPADKPKSAKKGVAVTPPTNPNAEMLEKVAKWVEANPLNAEERNCVQSLLCMLTGLPFEDVAPYLEDGAL